MPPCMLRPHVPIGMARLLMYFRQRLRHIQYNNGCHKAGKLLSSKPNVFGFDPPN
jgi:hypothetical protein